jgi:hypothetical protein|tara:strand:+ start:720 stop:908 length:189 start_codon:yes stop_codon:yes gene_type:complete
MGGKMMNDDSVNDLWEDMARLNMLYEELCWDHDDVLEFVPDYNEDVIVIRNKSRKKSSRHRG